MAGTSSPPMMNHVTSPNEPYPTAADLASATRTHVVQGGRWQVSARKLPISRAGAIDALESRVGIPIPEMIFGDNEVALRHAPTGWAIRFVAGDALDAVDKTGQGRLQVAHADDWARSREMSSVEGIRDVRAYDWSYSTEYRGTEEPGAAAGAPAAAPESTDAQTQTSPIPNGTSTTTITSSTSSSSPLRLAPSDIPSLPLELLRRRDPILFHDDVLLYESELDDNGISVVRVKLRAMPQRLLLLCRLYMRLDHVVVRVRDTRVYVDFGTDQVLREYTAREDTFENVRRNLAMRRGLHPDAVIVAMRDADQVAELLPVVQHSMESVELGGQAGLAGQEGQAIGP